MKNNIICITTILLLMAGNVKSACQLFTSAPPSYNFNDPTVLATANGVEYTMGTFNKGLRLGEFVLGQTLTSSEKRLAIQEVILNFNEAPYETVQGIETVHQAMNQIFNLNDALQIALARNLLLGEIYAAYAYTNESSVLFDLINKYIGIVQFDAVNKLVLTQQDMDACIYLAQFSAQLSGQVFNPSYDEISQVQQAIQYTFVYGTLEDKKSLCIINTYYELLVTNYQNLNNLEKQQLAQYYLAQNQVTQPTQQYYQNNPTNTGGMDWNAYNTLSNMSLQSHTAMLNSIEAIGGSGDYWYVK